MSVTAEAPNEGANNLASEGDLVFAIGAVPRANDAGFTPFIDENIRRLRGPLPLTIFSRKWQEAAMTYHLDKRKSDDSSAEKSSGGYKGYTFTPEWSQNHAAWTNNHRAFYNVLKDSYNMGVFTNLLAKHKATCDDIVDQYCFMVAFRYDIQVRQNVFSHRIAVDGKLAVPDISIKRHDILERCHNIARDLNELDWDDNLYASGLQYTHLDPHSGRPRGPMRAVSEKGPPGGRTSNSRDNEARPHEQFESSLPGGNESKKRNRGYKGSNYNPNYVDKRSQGRSGEHGNGHNGQRRADSNQQPHHKP